ncbi:uncharacterized protein LOC113501807 isoform X3 [Trichoplusia ni]|uniref:Uncharacterized protein LOC113501807 isoform X3 n=1 Tax=Trichoplusia ni TaxID=7111 RepID=A0A7E5WDV0_TRINI|nr:uncharacterized protein LOC113501807 isoform X3 [Trichoplusia ni]
MQGGVVGGICLLSFLLSIGRTEELAGVKDPEVPQNIQDLRRREDSKDLSELDSSDDLRNEIGLAVTETISQENEGRSGAMAQSSAFSFGGSSVSNAVALSNGGASSSSSSVYSDSFGSSSQSKATAVAGFSSQAPPLGLFNADFGPYKSLSSNFAQANAQSFSNSGNSYGQGLKPYPFSQSYPYDSESSSAQAQSDIGYFPTVPIVSPDNKGYSANQPSAMANRESYQTIGSIETKVRSDDRLYRSDPVFLSNVSPYGQEKSFTQGQPYIDNGLYRSAPLASSVSNPYGKGLSAAKPQALADSEPSQSVAEPNLSPYREGPNFDDLYQPEFLPSSVSNPNGQDKRLVQTPDRADAVYGDLKIQGASDAVYPIIKKPNPYANDYPAELIAYQPTDYSQPDKQLTSSLFTGGQSSPIAFEDAKSRVISPDEFIFLNKMPGGDNFIKCTKENEFHSFWSLGLDCLVCICLNEYGILAPVCASCSGCRTPAPKSPNVMPRLPEPITVRPASPPPGSQEPLQPTSEEPIPFPPPPEGIEPKPSPFSPPYPEPVEPKPSPFSPPYPEPVEPKPSPFSPPYPEPIGAPVPLPDPTPETLPTVSPPPSVGSCAPLPSGQPFTNPLHPCQICVCQEPNQTGKNDVQIQCKDNPQCIAPADVTTLPPIPDVSVPIPLPICEKFPEHVLFPHPTETCKLCKCARHMTDTGEAEQHITCYPHPDCIPKLEPVTEPPDNTLPPLPFPVEPFELKPFPPLVPIPIEPLREPIEAVPLPEIVTVEPLPWPPVTSTAIVSTSVTTPPLTPRPGPLPGPSPHESCRPYPPNQTFQHPWDECQICQCTESTAVGLINVEVNCYTKPSCCIEPPDALNAAGTGNPKPYISLNPSDDNQIIPIGSSASAASSSTFRPLAVYPPRPAIYPGSSQPADGLGPAYPAAFSRIKPEEAYSNQPSAYPYQQSYVPGYAKPQYADYPARLPVPNSPGYSQSNYGYPGNYPYSQGDTYPAPQSNYQSYDPRYPALPAPNVYPAVYSRPNYDIPSMYPSGSIIDGYPQAQGSAQGGNGLTAAQAYARDQLLRSKPDLSEDVEDT